jgi:hypothetical protein
MGAHGDGITSGPVWMSDTAFREGVAHVGCIIPEPQMCWIATWRVVTRVTDVDLIQLL